MPSLPGDILFLNDLSVSSNSSNLVGSTAIKSLNSWSSFVCQQVVIETGPLLSCVEKRRTLF